MGERVFTDTGDPRYDELPEGFVSAEPRPGKDGRCRFRLEETKIPVAHLAAVAERMGIALEEQDAVYVTFPAPYSQPMRLQWCMNVRKLAMHHDVDWPHLRDA